MRVCLAGHGGREEKTQARGSKPEPQATAVSGGTVDSIQGQRAPRQ